MKGSEFFLNALYSSDRDYNGVVWPCSLVLSSCLPSSLTHHIVTLSSQPCSPHFSHFISCLQFQITVTSVKLCVCSCVCVYACARVLRMMATNDNAELASRCQDSDPLFLLLCGCFSVTKSSKREMGLFPGMIK